MREPEGTLAPAQHEIMQVVWDRGETGVTVAEIWRTIAQTRSVTRTTILNQVDRLEKRGWLSRRPEEGGYRYVAMVDRQEAAGRLANEFVGEFFGGSAVNLVMSLLGNTQIEASEIERLRALLAQAGAQDTRGEA